MRPYDRNTPLIPAAHQPSLAVEYAQTQEIDLDRIIAGTGWQPGENAAHSLSISPASYLRLLGNIQREIGGHEVAFTMGHQMLPGHYGASSHALLQAKSLRSALEILTRNSTQFSPLLAAHFRVEGDIAVLHWTSACGLGALRGFVVDMHMAAVASMCHWRAGQRLPWNFCFNRTAPRLPAAHEVHLGARLQFGCQLDAMVIDAAWLDVAWEPAFSVPGAVNSRASQLAAQQENAPDSLLGSLYRYLLAHAQELPSLEEMADIFGMSPATLKRKLAAEDTHFQAEMDQVRSHVALQLMYFQGYDNEAVARYLGFYDSANFRRSFKRWTGMTPSLFRDGLFRFAPLS